LQKAAQQSAHSKTLSRHSVPIWEERAREATDVRVRVRFLAMPLATQLTTDD
jgi:hypothetical protein